MRLVCGSVVVPLEEVPVEGVGLDGGGWYGLGLEPTGRKPVVLVVDDEMLVADTLATILNKAGYTAMRAYDGYTAMEMAWACAPDLLITDVAMPGMNGVELALGMMSVAPKCKVVLFSGHATSLDLMRAYEAGHEFSLMAKPMHPLEVLGHVAKSLNAQA
jgi:DNA-binding NtrC family response regulator